MRSTPADHDIAKLVDSATREGLEDLGATPQREAAFASVFAARHPTPLRPLGDNHTVSIAPSDAKPAAPPKRRRVTFNAHQDKTYVERCATDAASTLRKTSLPRQFALHWTVMILSLIHI